VSGGYGVRLVAVDTDDYRDHRADGRHVATDTAAQVEHWAAVDDLPEPVGPVTRDRLACCLLETITREQHRVGAVELCCRPLSQDRLFGGCRDQIGGPLSP